jgi:hypothetical protein
MVIFITALTALGVATSSALGPAPLGVALRYRRPVGQVAKYRLSLEARGKQVGLGERLPVIWRAEMELTEEVISVGRGGVLRLRVHGRPVVVSDAVGTLAAGMMVDWPHLEFGVTPRGEVLDVSLALEEPKATCRARSLATLAAEPAPVVLPVGWIEVGADWRWERDGAHQINELVEVEGEGEWRIARIASTARAPLSLQEESEALGIRTRLWGEVAQQSQMDLLVSRGLPARQEGEMHVRTCSEVVLSLPEGGEIFWMESDIVVTFRLRLLTVDGLPVDVP